MRIKKKYIAFAQAHYQQMRMAFALSSAYYVREEHMWFL